MPRTKGAKNKNTGRRFKPYEGRRPEDKHLRMTRDMLTDPVYMGLSSSAKVLYQYMKLWAIGQDTVQYAASMTRDIMDSKTHRKARDELVEKGFIDYTNGHRAKYLRETAEYEFSSRWHSYKPRQPP